MEEKSIRVDDHAREGGAVNPWSLRRPQAKPETRTFEEPLQPGVSLTITLRPLLDSGKRLLAATYGDELCSEYLPGEDGSIKQQFASPDGDEVELNEPLLRNIGVLMTMQVPDEGGLPMTLADWLGWSVMCPNLFMGVLAWMGGLVTGTPEPTPLDPTTPR